MIATRPELKAALHRACLHQSQILEAPAIVVFAGDRDVARNNFEKVMAMEREAGAMDSRYEGLLRKFVPLAFGTGPAGLGWLGKALLVPAMRLFAPTPEVPAVHRRYWLAKQVSLSAMTFMLAAQAAGLATVPMEGFDEGRVRRALGLPRSMVVVLLVPVGYPAPEAENLKKTRLPLEDLVHWEGWGGKKPEA